MYLFRSVAVEKVIRAGRLIDRIIYYVAFAFAVMAGVAIFTMLFTTVADVFRRYMLNKPIAGVLELNEILFPVVVFLGIALTQALRGHIRVTLLISRIGSKWQGTLELITLVIAFAFWMFLGMQLWKEGLYSFAISEYRWGLIQIPIWWAKLLLPICSWLMSARLLRDAVVKAHHLLKGVPLEIPMDEMEKGI